MEELKNLLRQMGLTPAQRRVTERIDAKTCDREREGSMRLFHVSEEKDIRFFDPRPVTRRDLDQSKRYVWALNERYLPNFLTPRDCPRGHLACAGRHCQSGL